MARKKVKVNTFKFIPFSRKQMKLLTWWQDNSPVKDKFMMIADGSIRSGKTVVCALSFILYVMSHFNQQNAALCGKTVMSVRRNVLNVLKQMLPALGYEIIDHRNENYFEVIKGDIVNYVYLFGGKDEASQDLVQGLTLCSLFLDEVALMPESFYNQTTARLSIEGAKIWTSSNPNSPYHWFYRNVLKHLNEKDGLYVHFTLDDNPSLSDKIKDRYKTMYQGVWKKRFIEGKWSIADGLIYDMFDNKKNIIAPSDIPYDYAVDYRIGVDYGTGNATVFLLCIKTGEGKIYVCKEYYFAGRKEAQEQGDYDIQKTDLEYSYDMKEFIADSYIKTNKSYREIPIIVDPSASSFKLQLRKLHFKTKNAINDVIDGIRTVATYFSKGDLIISSECENLLREIHTYIWDEKAQMRGIDAPVKVNDHCVDALRYAVMNLRDKENIGRVALNVGI